MMTRTSDDVALIASPIAPDTACPSWCTHHELFGDQFQHVDYVSLRYPATKAHTTRRVFEIAAEKYVDTADGGAKAIVYFNDMGDGTLVSMAEVDEMAAALLRAGRLAFHEEANTPVTPRGIPADASPVGPCPSWCELADGHPWDEYCVLSMDDYGRTHQLHIGDVEVLWTEVPGSPDRAPVLVVDSLDLVSPADADKLAADIREATQLAFGDR